MRAFFQGTGWNAVQKVTQLQRQNGGTAHGYACRQGGSGRHRSFRRAFSGGRNRIEVFKAVLVHVLILPNLI
jgi:hypothetical protein